MTRVKQTVSRQAPWVAFGAVMLIANVGCGKMMLKGAAAASLRKVVDVGGNPFCTGHGEIVDSTWKVAADGSLADAVITVRGSKRASNLSTAPNVDQMKCEFVPHTVAIQAGQNLRFHNSDLTFHNIRIIRYDAQGKSANIDNFGQPSRGDENVKTFDAPGVYRLECDVHRWMNAWIFVHEGAHAAVSAADGRFSIPRALVDGDYVVEAWHPQFSQSITHTVTVRGGKGTAEFEFDFANAHNL